MVSQIVIVCSAVKAVCLFACKHCCSCVITQKVTITSLEVEKFHIDENSLVQSTKYIRWEI